MSDATLPTDDGTTSDATRRRTIIRLGIVFGGLYFIQGILEPQEGMIYQPLMAMLTVLGLTTEGRGVFMSWVGFPWSFKPIYGLLSDFLPIAGYRRRSWLLLTGGAAVLGYGVTAFFPAARTSTLVLLCCFATANLALAFTDVIVDAAMVETGQPLGITGRLQSIQWGCMYAAVALAKLAGGYLTTPNGQELALLLCTAIGCGTLALTLWGVREPRYAIPPQDLGSALRAFGRAFQSPVILLGGGFLFLLNFNPFTGEVLNAYETNELKFSPETIGHLSSLQAWAQMGASFLYATYCTRIRFPWLVHASVAFGILPTVGYWGLHGTTAAVPIFLLTGFAYQTATMIQLDLAARVCPPQIAGTMFALLMALSNSGISASSYFGGWWYDALTRRHGTHVAFDLLVAIGAGFTATCWVLVPGMLRIAARHDAAHAVSGAAAALQGSRQDPSPTDGNPI